LDGDSAYGEIRQVAFRGFDTIYRTMTIHYTNIHNSFDHQITNAFARIIHHLNKSIQAKVERS